MVIVVVEKDVYYSVDGIHRETLTKGEYDFDSLPSIAQRVCIREEFKVYDPSKTKNETQSTKKKTK